MVTDDDVNRALGIFAAGQHVSGATIEQRMRAVLEAFLAEIKNVENEYNKENSEINKLHKAAWSKRQRAIDEIVKKVCG